jgi:outer membrane protein assembly factor BamD (BamD/ComL family)
MDKHMVAAALLFALAAGQGSALAQQQQQETVRTEVGKPLMAAQELLRAGKYRDAITRVREADAIANLTPYERLLVDRIRGSAAMGAGDDATAIRSYESVLASGKLSPAETLPILESMAGAAYRQKDYPKAIALAERYVKEGGRNPKMLELKTSAHYLAGDFAGVVRDMQQRVQAIEQTPPLVDEATLRMLAASYAKLGDDAGYASTVEKLLVYHPKKEYWADRLARLQYSAGFADRLRLDLFRLRRVTDTMDEGDQYVEMAQLALQVGLPVEARRVVDAGFSSGHLGKGPDAARHQRLRDMVVKQAVEDEKLLQAEVVGRTGEALVNTGHALATAGSVDKGIELMEHGIAKGGLKRPDEARLHLGQAYLLSGNKSRALEAFKAVRGAEGLTDLARLWAIHAGKP